MKYATARTPIVMPDLVRHPRLSHNACCTVEKTSQKVTPGDKTTSSRVAFPAIIASEAKQSIFLLDRG